LGNDTTQQIQRTFAGANLLQTCCGLVTGKLVVQWILAFSPLDDML